MKCSEQAHPGRQKAGRQWARKVGMGVGGKLLAGTGFVSGETKMSRNYLWQWLSNPGIYSK